MTDILFLSLEDWDDIWRRNQFVCAELARRGYRIHFVGLPLNVTNDLRRGRLPKVPAVGPVPGYPNIVTSKPIKPMPDSIGLGRAINRWLYRRHVRRQVFCRTGVPPVPARAGLPCDGRPLLWANAQWAGHVAGMLGESAVIYDVTDDWSTLNQSPADRARVIADDAHLLVKADAVIVCSDKLLEIKRPHARSIHLIPNGVDVDHYRSVTEPADSSWPRPVFGYTGTVHPDRVDLSLVAELSSKRTAGSLVFIGPCDIPAETKRKLTDRGNVFFVGPMPYAQLPMAMQAFDVCIVPHVVSAFTESLNPIKLWEYMAAGKPIVSTPVAGFRDFPDLVRLASTADEFARQMTAALTEPVEKIMARRAVAASASWSSRVDDIVRVIESVTGKLPAGRGVGGTVAAVVVSYNTRERTLACLATLSAQVSDITVVDNGSTDCSAAAIAAAFPGVRLIRNETNVGFGRANNQAIRRATADWILLVNSDAFPDAGAVGRMIDFMADHPKAAVVGPRLVNADGSLQPSCYKFPGPLRATFEHTLLTAVLPNAAVVGDYRKWPHDSARRVEFVVGACLLVRRSAIDQVGLFDEDFFLYSEEVDWCRRFMNAGWEIWFTPDATVRHDGGGSGGAQPDAVFDEFHRGQERYLRKHHGPLGLIWYRAMVVLGSSLRIVLRPTRARPWWRLLTWTLGRRGPGLDPRSSEPKVPTRRPDRGVA